jgi:pyridoxine kinase
LVEKLGLPSSSSAAPGRYTSLLAPKERSSSYSQAEEAKEAKEAKETEDEDEILVCFASTRSKHPQRGDAMPETYGYALPTIRGYYSGVGDLFSALVLGHYKDQRSLDAAKEEKEVGSGRTLERAVSLALLGVQIVLLKTHLSTLPLNDNNNDKNDGNNTAGELDCIPSDDELDKEDNREDNKEDNKEDSKEDGDDVEPLRRPARRARRMRLRELRVVQERRALMDLADDENEDGGWKGKRLDWDALLREA